MRRQREPVVIIGAGGHAKVVIDIIRQQKLYDIIGCLDQAYSAGSFVSGVQIIGEDSMLAEIRNNGIHNVFIAIGENRKRDALARLATRLGFRLINAVSPRAYVSDTASLADGIAVMPGAIVNAGSRIMSNVIINTNASVDHDCVVEANCHIGPGCILAGNVYIGEGAFIGIGTKIIPQVSVGKWSITGAGSVVVSNIPDNTLAVGVPAKAVKSVNY